MTDEYDFFANGDGRGGGGYDEYAGDDGPHPRRHPRDVRAAQTRARSSEEGDRGTVYRAGFAEKPARRSRIAAGVALLAGLVAVVLGFASAAHESAPALVDPEGRVPGRYIAVGCAVAIAVSFLAVIVAKANLPRNSRRHRVASGGIVTLLLASLLLAFGVVCGVLFPDGLFKPNIRDEAPIGSASTMRYDIELTTGKCASGWTDIDVGSYPGVGSASMCADTRVAYVTFTSNTAKRMYDGPVQTQLSGLLARTADEASAQGGWRLLAGNQWLAFGPTDKMTSLEKEWGGTLTTVTPAQDTDDQGKDDQNDRNPQDAQEDAQETQDTQDAQETQDGGGES